MSESAAPASNPPNKPPSTPSHPVLSVVVDKTALSLSPQTPPTTLATGVAKETVEGFPNQTTTANSVEDLRHIVSRWLSIPDEDAEIIDFMLAVYVSHGIPGDPLWAMIVDASGGGKTELLRTLIDRPSSYFISNLSEKALISGYRGTNNKAKDPSLLPEMNGKVVIIKDLAPILSMRRESRNSILGQLRDIYDGFTSEGKGNIGKVDYAARFTLLTATTLAVDRQDAFQQELGERFIKFRARGEGRMSKTAMALRNLGRDDQMRKEIRDVVSDFLESLPPTDTTSIPEPLLERLARLSDFAAAGRSPVPRNRRGELLYHPKPEVGTRLGKELGKLLISLAVVRSKSKPDESDFATIRRVAEDCLPPNRLLVIQALRNQDNPQTTAGIVRATRLPTATTKYTLEDLQVLGVVNAEKTGWFLVSDCEWAPSVDMQRPGYLPFIRGEESAREGPPDANRHHKLIGLQDLNTQHALVATWDLESTYRVVLAGGCL